jgi:hypothetical protein
MARKSLQSIIRKRLEQLKDRSNDEDDAVVREIFRKCRMSMQNALALPGENTGARKAFELSGLDHRNLHHWRMLFEVLADECLAGPGRPKKWTPARLNSLLLDYRAVRESASGSIGKICKILATVEPYRKKWGHLKPSTLRRLLMHAVSHNGPRRRGLYRRAPQHRYGMPLSPEAKEILFTPLGDE